MSAAVSLPRCPNTTEWRGTGKHRHSSGQRVKSQCVHPMGHDGQCIYERLPSFQMVYTVALPEGGVETLNGNGEPLTFLQASDRAKATGGKLVSKAVDR